MLFLKKIQKFLKPEVICKKVLPIKLYSYLLLIYMSCKNESIWTVLLKMSVYFGFKQFQSNRKVINGIIATFNFRIHINDVFFRLCVAAIIIKENLLHPWRTIKLEET